MRQWVSTRRGLEAATVQYLDWLYGIWTVRYLDTAAEIQIPRPEGQAAIAE